MGNPAPSDFSLNRTLKHAHTRSHSRNNSISISSSASLPSAFPVAQKSTSTSAGGLNHFTFPLGNHNGATRTSRPLSMPLLPAATHANANNPNQNFAGSDWNPQSLSSTKRNSHHRRRSSVSTRHESAELMGISLPDLPPSTSDDNVNFGEKDSIRRRALLALEGKPDVAFNKVEIPDFSSSDTEKLMRKSLFPSLSLFSHPRTFIFPLYQPNRLSVLVQAQVLEVGLITRGILSNCLLHLHLPKTNFILLLRKKKRKRTRSLRIPATPNIRCPLPPFLSRKAARSLQLQIFL